MAIQYYMRGYNTAAPGAVGYVDWVVNDQPDTTAAFVPAPYASANIQNITINRVVTSKVGNFINPLAEPSFIAPNYTNPADGYFIHLNSYDWLNPNPTTGGGIPGAFPAPSQPIGMAVVRGASSPSGPVNPYSCLFWEEGTSTWYFAEINYDGSVGTALPAAMSALTLGSPASSTGILRLPNNESDGTGNTGAIKARNASNTGDVTLILADGSNLVNVGSASDPVYVPGPYLRVDNYISNGNPSSTSLSGFIRNPTASTGIITFRNTSGSADVIALSNNSPDGVSNAVVLGNSNASKVEINNVTLSFSNSGITNPTVTQNSTTSGNGQPLIVAAQSSTSTSGGPLVLKGGSGATYNGYVDLTAVGQTPPSLRVFATTGMDLTSSPSDYSPYGTSTLNAQSTISFNPLIRFPNTSISTNTTSFSGVSYPITGPVIVQDATIASNATGAPMLIVAQSSTGTGATTGGKLILAGGNSGTGGGSHGGNVQLSPGIGNTLLNNGEIDFQNGGNTYARFWKDSLNPFFEIGTGSNPAQSGYVRVPNNTIAVGARNPSNSGDMVLLASDNSGNIIIGNSTYTANTSSTVIAGNLTVLGTTTQVNSTVVDVEGRVIHANWIPSGFVSVPSFDGYVTGYTVGRGAQTISAKNDSAAILWTEGSQLTTGSDGYWRFMTLPQDNDLYSYSQAATAGSNPLSLMGLSFNSFENGSTNTVNPSAGVFPSVGAVRTQNNTTAVSARSTVNTDLHLLGSDSSNRILHGKLGANLGHIFNTSSSSIYDFQFASTSEVQIGNQYLQFTTNPATTGLIRAPNAVTVTAARNATNTGNLAIMGSDASNRVVMGDGYNSGVVHYTSLNSIYDFQFASVSQVQIGSGGGDGYIQFPTNAAQSGLIRAPYNTTILAARNNALAADIAVIGTDGYNNIFVGGGVNDGYVNINTTTGANIQVAGTTYTRLDGYGIEFIQTGSAYTVKQVNTTGVAQPLTIQAQNTTGAAQVGGNLILSSGSGNSVALDGYVDLQVAGTTVAAVIPTSDGYYQFASFYGTNYKVTNPLITANYQVSARDCIIGIGTLSNIITVTLPASPKIGDNYTVKDVNGSATSFNITIAGNGHNIDGSSTSLISSNYGAVEVVFTGSQWSII